MSSGNGTDNSDDERGVVAGWAEDEIFFRNSVLVSGSRIHDGTPSERMRKRSGVMSNLGTTRMKMEPQGQ
ncbi:hypothetical protein ES703_54090 [subsurface metagenome]